MAPENDDEKLQEMVKELAEKISTLFSESPEIKEALQQIERKGYRVDLVLASVTRILKKDMEAPPLEAPSDDGAPSTELNPFDRAFLQAIKVRPSSP